MQFFASDPLDFLPRLHRSNVNRPSHASDGKSADAAARSGRATEHCGPI
jgi:hypothetical protein